MTKTNVYKKVLDPKKIRHYYVDGSYNPSTGVAAAAVLVKGWKIPSYSITKHYRGKDQKSSTYAEHRAIQSALDDAKRKGYDLDHVIIHTDQKPLVSGIGKLKKMKASIESDGVRLKYLPSTHKINDSSTKSQINAYTVNQLAYEATAGYKNRYSLYLSNRRKKRQIERKETNEITG